MKLSEPKTVHNISGVDLDFYYVSDASNSKSPPIFFFSVEKDRKDLAAFVWCSILAGQRVLQVHDVKDKDIERKFGPHQGSAQAYRGK